MKEKVDAKAAAVEECSDKPPVLAAPGDQVPVEVEVKGRHEVQLAGEGLLARMRTNTA